jgi:hypothetical protein
LKGKEMAIKGNYEVIELDYKTAIDLVIKNHYLHRKAPCSKAFGLMDIEQKKIVGVVIYGVSASSTLLRGVCGEEEAKNVYELTRLWIEDTVPKNGESFLIGNTLKKLDKEIIVSYADSSQEHLGVVYQATNFLYTGLSSKFRDPKVKGLEHQHHATYANGMTNRQLLEKFGENLYYVDRPRKHRYVYFNASGRRKKELLNKLNYKQLPYPKAGVVIV